MNKELIQAIGDSLIRLRFLVGNQFIKPIKEMERESGAFFHPGFMHLMRWIMSKGNKPVSMSDLANAACISKPNLTTMVDRLCVEGYMERFADKNDRRVVNVALTQQGIHLLNQHKEFVMNLIEDRLSLLEGPELGKLKSALNDITDIIKIIEEKQGK